MRRLDMEVVLNSTLAGGVAIGSASDMVTNAGTAMAIGGFAGIVSAWGYIKLSPWLLEKIGLHDTCGVHNLHGMPGVIGGIFGCVFASIAETNYDSVTAINETFSAVNLILDAPDADGNTKMKLSCDGIDGDCWDLGT
jgi:ammonium transporter Rh